MTAPNIAKDICYCIERARAQGKLTQEQGGSSAYKLALLLVFFGRFSSCGKYNTSQLFHSLHGKLHEQDY